MGYSNNPQILYLRLALELANTNDMKSNHLKAYLWSQGQLDPGQLLALRDQPPPQHVEV